jgi:dTDP-4-dehydrorhamnose reductase
MSVLIVGASGLVGSVLVERAREQGMQVAGTYNTTQPSLDIPLYQLDVREQTAVRDVFDKVQPDVVVNCAAVTDVDECESNPETARAVNTMGAKTLAESCTERGGRFVQLSTDYVFGGDQRTPYYEDDDPNPGQVYGQSKLNGEQATLQAAPGALIVRLSFVFGDHGATNELAGFPAWVLGRARAGQQVPLYIDQHVTPTRAGYAAETMLELLDMDHTGTVHVASCDCVTPYEFGTVVLDEAGEDTSLVKESSLDRVETDASRPAYTCLSTERLADKLGERPPTLQTEIRTLFN